MKINFNDIKKFLQSEVSELDRYIALAVYIHKGSKELVIPNFKGCEFKTIAKLYAKNFLKEEYKDERQFDKGVFIYDQYEDKFEEITE